LDTLRQQITDANTNRQKLFEDALMRLRAERVGPTTAEKLFAISSALSRPTRTGKFVESLGNVGSVLGAQEAEKRKAQMDRAAMLEKYGFGQSDATIAGLEFQHDMGLKMQAAAAAARKAEQPGNVLVSPLGPIEPKTGLPVSTPIPKVYADLEANPTPENLQAMVEAYPRFVGPLQAAYQRGVAKFNATPSGGL
jgi:ribosomal protein S16